MYEIEKNIPVPTAERKNTTEFLRSMEIGDCFVCERKHREKLHGLAGKAGMKIKTKKENDDQIRIWRIK